MGAFRRNFDTLNPLQLELEAIPEEGILRSAPMTAVGTECGCPHVRYSAALGVGAEKGRLA